MSFLILVAIILAVAWWFAGRRAASQNEKSYLRRRGYDQEQRVDPDPQIDRDAYLFSLIESLSDLSPFARERAAQELGRICQNGNRDSRMFSGLVSALDDSYPSVRRAAASALAKLEDPEAIAHLERRIEVEESAPARVSLQKAVDSLRRLQTESENPKS